jgi:hypothetical protein
MCIKELCEKTKINIMDQIGFKKNLNSIFMKFSRGTKFEIVALLIHSIQQNFAQNICGATALKKRKFSWGILSDSVF